MFPLILSLALAFFSFVCSAFVILRIVIPILPPHPLSRRVAPAEFGLPNFRSLSPADKTHIWLASLDLLALAAFLWQAAIETAGDSADFDNAIHPASSVRLWFALTVRQSCLLIVAAITLLHVRMGRSVSLGAKHWMLWAPTLMLTLTSTGIAGVLSGVGVSSLFVGLVAYSSTVAVLSSVLFGCLIGTLIMIKRNLRLINDESDPWPPVRQMEEQPRPSFATEEIDALRDGASWITSNASSRHNSISAWSFSTHHTSGAPSLHGGRPQHSSVPAKSSFWFSSTKRHQDADVPPVPPLPSPYGPLSPTSESLSDPDPFRRDAPTPLPDHPRERLGSQTSWLTSTNGSQATVSAWSYPTTKPGGHEGMVSNASLASLHADLLPSGTASRPGTPAMANAKVLGGYGFAPTSRDSEKGLAALAAPSGPTIEISVYRAIGWLLLIWIPLVLAYPYLLTVSQNSSASAITSVLLILSVTLSSPLLALNILFRSPIPIPSGLFDARDDLPANVVRGPTPAGSVPASKWSHEYKRSTSASVTVVEGRRSGDVWVANGDAVDGKSKMSRALGMISPMPKLSVLPPEEPEDGEITPPLPLQMDESSLPIHNTPHSETSAQFGRLRKDSKASSHLSGPDESLAYASRIMIAQRHYSTLAQTLLVSSSPEKHASEGGNVVLNASTAVFAAGSARHSAHLRSRSVSSATVPHSTGNISPPPSFPLPPTPPSIRAARLAQLKHKKSFSSGFSFGAVDDMNEIDALTAGVLPLLVPGLTVGQDMRIKEGDWTPPGTFSKSKGKRLAKRLNEFGEDFSSPEVHSTPARARPRQVKGRKETHKRHHYSLPSLGLGKDGIHSLTTEISRALESKVNRYLATPNNVDVGRRNTVIGAEFTPNTIPHLYAVTEEEAGGLSRTRSTRSLGLRADVPHNIDTARSSMASVRMVPPPSAASTVTLFEEFEAGLDSGPQAESTPHNTVTHKSKYHQEHPPLPSSSHVTNTSANRRSSIVYIKSDDDGPSTTPAAIAATPSRKSSFAQWSSRAVRPLMPKSGKLQRKISAAQPGSPGGGLRPLTLLRERDSNAVEQGETRPLSLGKKHKSRAGPSAHDENVDPDPAAKQHKNLKSLQLARSETSKMRGVIMKEEPLPDVVIRPPSEVHTGFAYSRD